MDRNKKCVVYTQKKKSLISVLLLDSFAFTFRYNILHANCSPKDKKIHRKTEIRDTSCDFKNARHCRAQRTKL